MAYKEITIRPIADRSSTIIDPNILMILIALGLGWNKNTNQRARSWHMWLHIKLKKNFATENTIDSEEW